MRMIRGSGGIKSLRMFGNLRVRCLWCHRITREVYRAYKVRVAKKTCSALKLIFPDDLVASLDYSHGASYDDASRNPDRWWRNHKWGKVFSVLYCFGLTRRDGRQGK